MRSTNLGQLVTPRAPALPGPLARLSPRVGISSFRKRPARGVLSSIAKMDHSPLRMADGGLMAINDPEKLRRALMTENMRSVPADLLKYGLTEGVPAALSSLIPFGIGKIGMKMIPSGFLGRTFEAMGVNPFSPESIMKYAHKYPKFFDMPQFAALGASLATPSPDDIRDDAADIASRVSFTPPW